MNLDAVIPQDGSARLARMLTTIDEKNRLAGKEWHATKLRWAIHKTPPKVERSAWEGRRPDCPPRGRGIQEEMGKIGFGREHKMLRLGSTPAGQTRASLCHLGGACSLRSECDARRCTLDRVLDHPGPPLLQQPHEPACT